MPITIQYGPISAAMELGRRAGQGRGEYQRQQDALQQANIEFARQQQADQFQMSRALQYQQLRQQEQEQQVARAQDQAKFEAQQEYRGWQQQQAQQASQLDQQSQQRLQQQFGAQFGAQQQQVEFEQNRQQQQDTFNEEMRRAAAERATRGLDIREAGQGPTPQQVEKQEIGDIDRHIQSITRQLSANRKRLKAVTGMVSYTGPTAKSGKEQDFETLSRAVKEGEDALAKFGDLRFKLTMPGGAPPVPTTAPTRDEIQQTASAIVGGLITGYRVAPGQTVADLKRLFDPRLDAALNIVKNLPEDIKKEARFILDQELRRLVSSRK